jgi:hypothetical protein
LQIHVQIAAFWLLLVVFFLWILNFFGNIASGDSFPVEAIGHTQRGVVGTVLLNYAFVVTVPSWVNEKRPDVDVNNAIWWANLAGTVTFILIGWLGARAFNYGPVGNQEDMTAKLGEAGDHVWMATRVATYLFPWAALVSGIPVMSIIIRYQLLENKVCGVFWANVWSVLVQWVAALLFYQGNALNDLMDWASLIVMAPINFILPCYLYYAAGTDEGQQRLAAFVEAGGDIDLLDKEPLIASNETQATAFRQHGDDGDAAEHDETFRVLPDKHAWMLTPLVVSGAIPFFMFSCFHASRLHDIHEGFALLRHAYNSFAYNSYTPPLAYLRLSLTNSSTGGHRARLLGDECVRLYGRGRDIW